MEIYLEYPNPKNGLPYIISFGINNKQHSEYYQLVNSKEVINNFTKYIKQNKDTSKFFFPEGWVKNGDGTMYYLIVKDHSIKDIIKYLCYTINPNEKNTIDEWFNEYKDLKINVIGYTIKNGNIKLNIYAFKIPFILKIFRYILKIQF
jgi:hypothetical protein